jgi:Holliday junction resolvase RusA-like endonuclease
MTIEVFVPGDPKPQPRPRAFSRGGKAGVYDPKTAAAWKQKIAYALRPWHRQLLVGPVEVWLRFSLRRPNSHYNMKRLTLKKQAPEYPLSKYDVDNLAKVPLDAATLMGVWRDDSQVVGLTVTKVYNDDNPPGLAIRIESADPLEVDSPLRGEGLPLGPGAPRAVEAGPSPASKETP